MKEKKLIKENILLLLGLFLIPTFLEQLIKLGPSKQFVIGTIVNASLILISANKKNTYKELLLISLPSISTICSGLLFGGLSFYSKLMIPFIWLGNASLIYGYRHLKKYKLLSIILKTITIYTGYLLISNIFNFPIPIKNVLNLSMGIYQLITGILGYILYKLIKKHSF